MESVLDYLHGPSVISGVLSVEEQLAGAREMAAGPGLALKMQVGAMCRGSPQPPEVGRARVDSSLELPEGTAPC